MKNLAVLGSTGSIGTSTLDICRTYPDRYRVSALAAGRNVELAFRQCVEFRPEVVSMSSEFLAEAACRTST